MKKIFILVFLLFLVGCDVQLETPFNLSFHQDILSWEEVNGASAYEVMINDEVYVVEEERFDCSVLDEGSYTCRVVAKTSFNKSSPSIDFSFTISRTYPVPTNLRIEAGKFTWDGDERTIGYEITGNDEIVTLVENYILLENIAPNEFYSFEIRAVYPFNHYSEKTDVFPYHSFSVLTEKVETEFEVNSVEDLVIVLNNKEIIQIQKEEDIVSSEDYWIEEDNLYFSSGLLKAYDIGIHSFFLFTNQGVFTLEINIYDESEPFLESNGNITYQGEDIVLTFSLNGGRIIQLDGATLDLDYSIVENQVTIKKSFIDQIFADPERELLVLGYQIENDYHFVIGYVFIYRN